MITELVGAPVIDADEISHQVQSPDGAAYAELIEHFGREILAPDGTIDRRKVAGLVFADRARLAELNAIMHPKVRAEELRLLDEYRHKPLVVFMVPLLFENGLDSLVDRVAVVVTKDEVRRERLKRRNSWSDSEISRRLTAQWPDDEKVRRAHFVIDNSGTLEETREQVIRMLRTLGMNFRMT
jgi:dephospho-CoA kinase